MLNIAEMVDRESKALRRKDQDYGISRNGSEFLIRIIERRPRLFMNVRGHIERILWREKTLAVLRHVVLYESRHLTHAVHSSAVIERVVTIQRGEKWCTSLTAISVATRALHCIDSSPVDGVWFPVGKTDEPASSKGLAVWLGCGEPVDVIDDISHWLSVVVEGPAVFTADEALLYAISKADYVASALMIHREESRKVDHRRGKGLHSRFCMAAGATQLCARVATCIERSLVENQ